MISTLYLVVYLYAILMAKIYSAIFLFSISISQWVWPAPGVNGDLSALWFTRYKFKCECFIANNLFINLSYSTSCQGPPCTFSFYHSDAWEVFFFLVDSRATQEGGVYCLWFKVIAEISQSLLSMGPGGIILSITIILSSHLLSSGWDVISSL